MMTKDEDTSAGAQAGTPVKDTDDPDIVPLKVRDAQTWPLPNRTTSKRAKSASLHGSEIPIDRPTVLIRITMPHDFGVRSWRWYEAILEALAVGIYLYATFVLTSAQFFTGEMALTFASLVTLCLSGVRILGTLF